MQLVYLTANAAYAVTFGDQLVQLGDGPMFFSSREEARSALLRHRLDVEPSGRVRAVEEIRAEPTP